MSGNEPPASHRSGLPAGAYTGWLLDLYADEHSGDLALWMLCDDGRRLRLRQSFPMTFYAAGPDERLRALWRWLQARGTGARLARAEGRDLFAPGPVTVLAIQVPQAARQPRLFREVERNFPDLVYYDADIQPLARWAAGFDVFPLTRFQAQVGVDGCVEAVEPLEGRWALVPAPAPLRILYLEPDADPGHASPAHLLLRCGRYTNRLPLAPARPLLAALAALLRRFDPDLLLSQWGDSWLLPRLLELSEQEDFPLPLNRDPALPVQRREERSYHAYGQVVYRAEQSLLCGRWHIDRCNSMMLAQCAAGDTNGAAGLEGVLELARVSGLPVQVAARNSPGAGITAMQTITALQAGILVPYQKGQTEFEKSALELIRADRGGLIFQPLVGLHRDVAEIDFISMYPSILRTFNISPETVIANEEGSYTGATPQPRVTTSTSTAPAPFILEGTLSEHVRESASMAQAPFFREGTPQWHVTASTCTAQAPFSLKGTLTDMSLRPVRKRHGGGFATKQSQLQQSRLLDGTEIASPPPKTAAARNDMPRGKFLKSGLFDVEVPHTAGRSDIANRLCAGDTVQVPELNLLVRQSPPGLLPLTLAPLLEKRTAIKAQLSGMDRRDCRFGALKARSTALKWLLVVCFGYTGYKNARFGRIEAHQAITAYAREAVLRAKEAAESLGFTVLHLYVDGLWVQRPGACRPADFQPLLDEVARRTRLSIALDGIYRWIAFLSSRQNPGEPVPNRYFGVFQNGEIKARGIELRRGDACPFVAGVQAELLDCLARAPEADSLPARLPEAIRLVRRRLRELRAGSVPLEALVVRQRLSRKLEEYRSPSPAARAAAQLQLSGRALPHPGQKVRFLYTRGEPGVWAWDLPAPPDPRMVDTERYWHLLLRAAAAVLGPLGLEETELRRWVLDSGLQDPML